MNSTEIQNFSFNPFLTKLQWLEMFSMSWLVDYLYLFLITPFNIAGIVMNLLCFAILRHKKFQKSDELYSYFRVNIVNSLLINILEFLLLFSHTYVLSDFANIRLVSLFFCYAYSPLSNFAILYGSFLDICISIERISQFTPKIGIIHKIRPSFVYLALFLISVLINVQFIFQFEPIAIDVKLDPVTNYRINFWRLSDYAQTQAGLIISYSTYVLRDVVVLAIEIGMNISMVVLLRKYLDFKNRLQNPSKSGKFKNKVINKSDRNATIMVILMSSLSVLQHIFFLVMTIYFMFYLNQTGFLLGIVENFVLSFKHFSNFIFLFLFNKEFRLVFKIYFKIRL